MRRKFVYWSPFLATCEAIGMDDIALRAIEKTLLLNPESGAMVEGTGGARKVRAKFAGHGKSGGVRVIYYDTGTTIHFLMVYPKSTQADLTPIQKKLLHKATQKIRKER